jgi:hypothetical protein
MLYATTIRNANEVARNLIDSAAHCVATSLEIVLCFIAFIILQFYPDAKRDTVKCFLLVGFFQVSRDAHAFSLSVFISTNFIVFL